MTNEQAKDWDAPATSQNTTTLGGAGADWGFTPTPVPANTAPVLVTKVTATWETAKASKDYRKWTRGSVTFYLPRKGWKTPGFGEAGYLSDPENWV